MHVISTRNDNFDSFLNRLVFTIATALIFCTSRALAADNSWQSLLREGDNNINQQKLVQAEDCFRRALKEVKHSPHTVDDKVKCLERLASTLVLENKIIGAIPIYHKSLHLLEQTYGNKSPKIVPTLFALGSIFESEGDPKIAMGLYHRALTINEENYGPLSPTVADSLQRLGHAYFRAGQTDQAETHYKASLKILMQQPGLSSSKQLESLLANYNDLLQKNDTSSKRLLSDFQKEILKDRRGFPVPTAGVTPSAWQKEMTAASAQRKNFQNNEEQRVLLRGFKQPFTDTTLAPAYHIQSEVLNNQHPYKQGEDYYERMVAIDIKALGPNHPSVADDLTALALLYISQERYAEAKPILLQALSIYENMYGSNNLLVTRTRESLALVYNKLGESQRALALYDDAITKSHVSLVPNNLETARMLNELGFYYYSQGKLEDACTIYQWALAGTKASVGEQNILLAACMIDYANVLKSLGHDAEACDMQEQALKIKTALFDNMRTSDSDHWPIALLATHFLLPQ